MAVTDEQRRQDTLRQRDRVFHPHVAATLKLTLRQRMFGHKVTSPRRRGDVTALAGLHVWQAELTFIN